MSSIYPNRKNGKIISFKFKVCIGIDENNKQIFKCKTWTPEKSMSESKLKDLAKKEATLWEHQVMENYCNQQESAFEPNITFLEFVEEKWKNEECNNSE